MRLALANASFGTFIFLCTGTGGSDLDSRKLQISVGFVRFVCIVAAAAGHIAALGRNAAVGAIADAQLFLFRAAQASYQMPIC